MEPGARAAPSQTVHCKTEDLGRARQHPRPRPPPPPDVSIRPPGPWRTCPRAFLRLVLAAWHSAARRPLNFFPASLHQLDHVPLRPRGHLLVEWPRPRAPLFAPVALPASRDRRPPNGAPRLGCRASTPPATSLPRPASSAPGAPFGGAFFTAAAQTVVGPAAAGPCGPAATRGARLQRSRSTGLSQRLAFLAPPPLWLSPAGRPCVPRARGAAPPATPAGAPGSPARRAAQRRSAPARRGAVRRGCCTPPLTHLNLRLPRKPLASQPGRPGPQSIACSRLGPAPPPCPAPARRRRPPTPQPLRARPTARPRPWVARRRGAAETVAPLNRYRP
jgi:hypothetical protein